MKPVDAQKLNFLFFDLRNAENQNKFHEMCISSGSLISRHSKGPAEKCNDFYDWIAAAGGDGALSANSQPNINLIYWLRAVFGSIIFSLFILSSFCAIKYDDRYGERCVLHFLPLKRT